MMVDENTLSHLARCGLLFMSGPPPAAEDSTMLVWNGGCNAIAAYRDRNGALVEFESGEPIYEKEVYCWMRMPLPRYWTVVEMPNDMIDGDDLYDGGHQSVFDMECGAE